MYAGVGSFIFHEPPGLVAEGQGGALVTPVQFPCFHPERIGHLINPLPRGGGLLRYVVVRDPRVYVTDWTPPGFAAEIRARRDAPRGDGLAARCAGGAGGLLKSSAG